MPGGCKIVGVTMTRLINTIAAFAAATLLLGGPAAAYERDNYVDAGVETLCNKLARKLGSVKLHHCMDAGLRPSGGYSTDGLPLAMRTAGYGNPSPSARVLLLGGIHGDEFSGVSIVFNWLRRLDQNGVGDFLWHIVPTANPDGILRRKAQRMNANGVDLNRNFPTPNWDVLSQKYWIKRTRRNPRRYPGHAAASEPETRWIMDEIDRFQPDVVVQVHAPYGIVDFDGEREPPQKLGRLHLRLLGTYPGSLGNYGLQRDVPVLTIELPSAGSMPSQREMDRIWRDMVKWVETNIAPQARVVNSEYR